MWNTDQCLCNNLANVEMLEIMEVTVFLLCMGRESVKLSSVWISPGETACETFACISNDPTKAIHGYFIFTFFMFPAILPSNWLFLTPSRVFINVCEVSGLNIQYMRITSVEIIPHHTNTFQSYEFDHCWRKMCILTIRKQCYHKGCYCLSDSGDGPL